MSICCNAQMLFICSKRHVCFGWSSIVYVLCMRCDCSNHYGLTLHLQLPLICMSLCVIEVPLADCFIYNLRDIFMCAYWLQIEASFVLQLLWWTDDGTGFIFSILETEFTNLSSLVDIIGKKYSSCTHIYCTCFMVNVNRHVYNIVKDHHLKVPFLATVFLGRHVESVAALDHKTQRAKGCHIFNFRFSSSRD